MIESQHVNGQFNNDGIKKPYKKQLVLQQRQAYQGAKMFYFGVLPLSIIGLIFFTAFLYEQSNINQKTHILNIYLYIFLTLISYIIAVYYYIKCNKIDTCPAPKSFNKQSQLNNYKQNKNNIINSYQSSSSLNDNQNLQLKQSPSSSSKPSRHYCTYCNQTCQYRTRHCHKCQTCIQKYDHHCFWIGNCVGKHNHRHFYIFLIVQSFNNYIEMQAILQVKNYANDIQIHLHWTIWLILYSMLLTSIGFLCFTGYLAIYHTMLITLSMTTWQQMRRDKISYLKYLPKGYNPFSIGWKNNIIKFFTQQTKSNSNNCYLQSWELYLPAYQEAKIIKPKFNFIDNQYYSCC